MTQRRGPLVSVHLVTYDQAPFLRETLDSALSQDYDPLEVVVADDASTDGTVDILREYQRRHRDKLQVVIGDRNVGVTANSNRALERCRGTYVAFQGGDDILLPGKIRRQVAWLEGGGDRVLCGHDVEHFDSDTGSRLLLHSQMAPMREGSGPDLFVRAGPLFAATSVMVRRDSLPRHGFDERLTMASDWRCWIETVTGGGQFGYVDEVLARYRRHHGNVTRRYASECRADVLMTLALTEAEQPSLADACREGRARVHQAEALGLLGNGEISAAKAYFRVAAREDPTLKRLAWLVVAYLPSALRRTLVSSRRLPDRDATSAVRWRGKQR